MPMFDDSDFAKLDVDNVMENVEILIDPSTSTAGDIFEDEMMTIADTLVAIRSTRPRTTSVVIRDVEEEPRRATTVPTIQSQDKGKGKMVELKPTTKNPIKTQIQRDAEIAQRLHEEEKDELERMQRERAAQEEASNAFLIAEFDNVQTRMEADVLLAARLQEKEREQSSIDEQARFLMETITERKRFFAAQRAEQIRNKPPTKIQLRNKMITYLENMGRFTYVTNEILAVKELEFALHQVSKTCEELGRGVSWTIGLHAESMIYLFMSPSKRKFRWGIMRSTGIKHYIDPIFGCKIWRTNRKCRIPIDLYQCKVEESTTLKKVGDQMIGVIRRRRINKEGNVSRFQEYHTSDEEEEELSKHPPYNKYGFMDHPQLQMEDQRNKFTPYPLPPQEGNMNDWLIDDANDSDLESTA
ncbi:hypothetical protein Tco_1089019 [Tanacetum coccineum]